MQRSVLICDFIFLNPLAAFFPLFDFIYVMIARIILFRIVFFSVSRSDHFYSVCPVQPIHRWYSSAVAIVVVGCRFVDKFRVDRWHISDVIFFVESQRKK